MSTDLENIKALIDFDNPEEDLVFRAIFSEAGENEQRGFLNAFSPEEIQRMAASPNIDNWLQPHQEWIKFAASKL